MHCSSRFYIASAISLTLGFPASAYADAFDSATCAKFLVGTWDGSITNNSQPESFGAVFGDDGKVTMSVTPMGKPTKTMTGTWKASPGHALNHCAVELTHDGNTKPREQPIKVLDQNTFKASGDLFKRKLDVNRGPE